MIYPFLVTWFFSTALCLFRIPEETPEDLTSSASDTSTEDSSYLLVQSEHTLPLACEEEPDYDTEEFEEDFGDESEGVWRVVEEGKMNLEGEFGCKSNLEQAILETTTAGEGHHSPKRTRSQGRKLKRREMSLLVDYLSLLIETLQAKLRVAKKRVKKYRKKSRALSESFVLVNSSDWKESDHQVRQARFGDLPPTHFIENLTYSRYHHTDSLPEHLLAGESYGVERSVKTLQGPKFSLFEWDLWKEPARTPLVTLLHLNEGEWDSVWVESDHGSFGMVLDKDKSLMIARFDQNGLVLQGQMISILGK